MLKTREMAYPAPTKGCSKLSPDTTMLFAPFGCTHLPPPALPFLLAQSLSSLVPNPSTPPAFDHFHTGSDQKLEVWKALERG